MKILLSEKLRRLRKNADLTQEQFACAIGVSPQSVSKWERDEGYPDISLLPAIANYFKITIDELLGNDNDSANEDVQNFHKKLWEIEDTEEQIALATEYYRKYPKNYSLANLLCVLIKNDRNNMENYLPIAREACERVLSECTDQHKRDIALRNMCIFCPDEKLEKWLEMCPLDYAFNRAEYREERLWRQNKLDESRFIHDVNNLRILLHFLGRDPRTWRNAYKWAEWYKFCISLLDSFREDGVLPLAWLGCYTRYHFQAAFGLCGYGNFEEFHTYMDRAFELYEEWLKIPGDEMLHFGNNFIFGGLKIKRSSMDYSDEDAHVTSPDGEGIEIAKLHELFLDSDYFYQGLASNWAYFNPARDTDEFKAYVERAKKIAEKYDPSVFEEE